MQETLQLPSGEPKEVSAATTLIPYRYSDSRAKYLGWLCCGFSDEESLMVLGLTRSWLTDARQDVKFSDLEEHIPELRKQLGQEYLEIDFRRNYKMLLEKDRRVIRTSLGMELVVDEETGEMVPEQLSAFDQQYLLKMRGAYTPQQLQLLKAIASGGGEDFNFSRWVSQNQDKIVGISRTDTVIVKEQDAQED